MTRKTTDIVRAAATTSALLFCLTLSAHAQTTTATSPASSQPPPQRAPSSFTGLPRPRSVVANQGIYYWRDGRTNADTMTAVFDYGPLNDMSKGFQVTYSSRMTNSAGGTKEYYFSNAGMINMDTGKVSPDGGLKKREADEMGAQPNLLTEMSLAEAAKVETSANTGVDDSTSAHMRNWMECVRSRKAPNADVTAGYNHSVALCMTIAALRTGQRITFDDAKQDVIIGGDAMMSKKE